MYFFDFPKSAGLEQNFGAVKGQVLLPFEDTLIAFSRRWCAAD
jgi:hypothetical protein